MRQPITIENFSQTQISNEAIQADSRWCQERQPISASGVYRFCLAFCFELIGSTYCTFLVSSVKILWLCYFVCVVSCLTAAVFLDAEPDMESQEYLKESRYSRFRLLIGNYLNVLFHDKTLNLKHPHVYARSTSIPPPLHTNPVIRTPTGNLSLPSCKNLVLCLDMHQLFSLTVLHIYLRQQLNQGRHELRWSNDANLCLMWLKR